MDPIISQLKELLQKRQLIPFIGAGFSESCGCPNGNDLARRLLSNFPITPRDSADSTPPDLWRLTEFLQVTRDGDSQSIIAEIKQILNQTCSPVAGSRPHTLLPLLDAPIIYTTNYDQLVENAFDHLGLPYQSIVTTSDIINSATCPDTQIVKFHGSLESPATIVLTESDLYERLEFTTPMDIKLRADAMGRSLLFMGYSFSDFNVRYLWFKIRRMIREAITLPPSYILIPEADHIAEILLNNRGITPINVSAWPGDNLSGQLASFLSQLVDG